MGKIKSNEFVPTARRQAAAIRIAQKIDKYSRMETKAYDPNTALDAEMAFSGIADVVGFWLSGETDEHVEKWIEVLSNAIRESQKAHKEKAA